MRAKIGRAWFDALKSHMEREGLSIVLAEERGPGLGQGPRVQKPYLSLRFDGPRKLGEDDLVWREGKFVLDGLREYTLSVQAFGVDASEILAELQTRLGDPALTEALSKSGIGVIDGGDVLNVTEIVDTGFEERAIMDVRFYCPAHHEPAESSIKTVESVEYEGEVENGKTMTVTGVIP